MPNRIVFWLILISIGFLAGIGILSCASHATAIPTPSRFETYCGTQRFDIAAFLRVVDSAKDEVLNTQATRITNLRRFTKSSGGAIGYWDNEVGLAMPNAGKRVPPGDSRLHIRGAAVEDDGHHNRLYFLQAMGRPGVWSWIDYETSDNERICR